LTEIFLQPRGPEGGGPRFLSAEPPRNPTLADGNEADFWYHRQTFQLWRRTGGYWQPAGALHGPQGVPGEVGPATPGTPGADGTSTRNGPAAPTTGDGNDGDFWIQTSGAGAPILFGPKAGGTWPAGIPMMILVHGSTAPAIGTGVSGQLYIDYVAGKLYGPKAGTAWGTGKSLVGPTGSTGPTGNTGPTGAPGPESWAVPVDWVTATPYVATSPRSVVVMTGETYVCLISHTSGTFATDVSAGRWKKVAAKGADGAGSGNVNYAGGVTTGNVVVVGSAANTIQSGAAPPLTTLGGTLTGRLNIAPSSTAGAGFNIGTGSAPDAPNRVNGDIWYSGGELIGFTGGQTLRALSTFESNDQTTRKLTVKPSTTGAAGFNLQQGTAPTTPIDGDLWTTTLGLYARIGGATKKYLETTGDGSQLTNVGGGWQLLATMTAANSASLDNTTALASIYTLYAFYIEDIVGATITQFAMQVSTDAGATWKTSQYLNANSSGTEGHILLTVSDLFSGDFSIWDKGLSMMLNMSNPAGTTLPKKVWGHGSCASQTGGTVGVEQIQVSGFWNGGADAINGVRFKCLSGNIVSGKVRIYGIRTT
jgi:hypothetical protein